MRPCRLASTALLLPLLVVLAGCSPPADAPRSGPLKLVATTNIVADTARRIAGEHASVEALMGPGVDPHLFKASESDVRRLAEADLILYNGLHLEGKMGDILVKMARSRPVVALGDGIPEEALREPPELAGQYDPHVWFDVSLWARTLPVIAEELARLDPQHAAEYRANAEAYGAELAALDAWIGEQVRTLAPERRVLVTAHDAFGYFGERYGMEVVGLQGISTLAEAGLQDVERVVDLVVERGVPAMFVESSVPRRSIEAVQAAVRDRGGEVTIGGELHSDSLGAAGTPAGTYPGMVRANVETIVEALR
ncbi:MAG TPA: zinc ABC transporter substrate-binding protein [Thermoanaerobaculia bacterium]|nr:zinc ABC transporter substrate-binding protein [Thermoanaerobaculia bacterium]